MMKKQILSLALAFVMVLAMGTVALAEEATAEVTVTPIEVDTVPGIVAITAPIDVPDLWAPIFLAGGDRPADALSLRDAAQNPPLLYPEAYGVDPDAVQIFGGTFTVDVGQTIVVRFPQINLSVDGRYPVGITIMGGEEFITYQNSILRDRQTWDTPIWMIRSDENGPYIDFFFTGVADGVVEFVSRTPGFRGLSYYRIVVGTGGDAVVTPVTLPAPVTTPVTLPAPAPAPAEEAAPVEVDLANVPPEIAAFVGRWECQDAPHIWACTLTFDADSRFVDRDGDWGTFTVFGNRVLFSFDEFYPVSFYFSFYGDQLNLTHGLVTIVLHRA